MEVLNPDFPGPGIHTHSIPECPRLVAYIYIIKILSSSLVPPPLFLQTYNKRNSLQATSTRFCLVISPSLEQGNCLYRWRASPVWIDGPSTLLREYPRSTMRKGNSTTRSSNKWSTEECFFTKSKGTEYSFILRNASEELERTYANYLYPYRSKFSAHSV